MLPVVLALGWYTQNAMCGALLSLCLTASVFISRRKDQCSFFSPRDYKDIYICTDYVLNCWYQAVRISRDSEEI